MPVYRATIDLRYAAGSGRGTNTWCLRTTGGATEGGDIEALMGFVRNFYADLLGLFPSQSTFTWDGTVQELGTPDPGFREPRPTWTETGTNVASTYGPAPAMVCVTWRSSLATRSGRGRTFLGPISAGTFEGDGSIATGNLAAIRAAAATLVDDSTDYDADGALAVWSEADQLARDFVGSTVTDQAAVLRSRR